MAFSDTNISGLTVTRKLGGTFVEWESTDPEDTVFQVYVDGVHVWSGTARWIQLPPAAHGRSRTIQVGAVDDDEGSTDFAASLPTAPSTGDRPVLTWAGGTYLSDTIEGYHIYRAATAGGAVSYAAAVATVAAYPGGLILDGFGVGPFGQGGFGRAQASYTWTGEPLETGTWRHGVAAFDVAGNEVASPSEVDVDVVALPKPPAADADGKRITYTYDSGTGVAVLSWLAGT